MSKQKHYPLEIQAWLDCGYYSYGTHSREDFIVALSDYLGDPVEAVEGFIQEYGYNVPATHYSDYGTMWYGCNGPQRGARPITQCYDYKLKPRETTE